MTITSITLSLTTHQEITIDGDKLAEICEDCDLNLPRNFKELKDEEELMDALEEYVGDYGDSSTDDFEIPDYDEEEDED